MIEKRVEGGLVPTLHARLVELALARVGRAEVLHQEVYLLDKVDAQGTVATLEPETKRDMLCKGLAELGPSCLLGKG